MASPKTKPVFTPPVQVSHLYYRLARVLVWAGMTRYHRVLGVRDMGPLPAQGTPAIFISNHQNGMMDPLVSCAFVPQQIHWLTRADVFWNGFARHVMYGFNQMPIYRQRDRVADIRERNDIIFDVCVERLHAGAAMGIFPEGNHNPFPSLRAFKGGLAEMLARSAAKHTELKDIQVVPVGVEYEDYVQFRRQLRVRTGQAVPFADLLSDDGTLDKRAFNERLRKALGALVMDIQPEEAQPYFHPAARAMRPTEQGLDSWKSMPELLAKWAEKWNDEAWKTQVRARFEAFEAAWKQAGHVGRPEAWGRSMEDVRRARPWIPLLSLLSWVGNFPSLPGELLIKRIVRKTVKKPEFISTMSLGYGIVLLPLTWFLWSILAATFAPTGLGWVAAAATWCWSQAGSRFHAWHASEMHDWRDQRDGHSFWNDDANRTLRERWTAYLQAFEG